MWEAAITGYRIWIWECAHSLGGYSLVLPDLELLIGALLQYSLADLITKLELDTKAQARERRTRAFDKGAPKIRNRPVYPIDQNFPSSLA